MKNSLKQMHHWSALVIIITCWVSLACDPAPKSDWAQGHRFQADLWKKDKLGCQGQREKLSAEFDTIRRNLLGMTQDQIRQLLGSPDFQMLQTRNQKSYIYFIEKGEQCRNSQAESKAKTVAIRFSATGYATEVNYQLGKP